MAREANQQKLTTTYSTITIAQQLWRLIALQPWWAWLTKFCAHHQ